MSPLAPMEMRSIDVIPDGPGWQYEPKWDGFRCIAQRAGSDVTLTSKVGQPLARYFPEVVAGLRTIRATDFVLDGELVVPLAGALSFDALQQRIHPAASRVAMLAEKTPALLLAFDLLQLESRDLAGAPLEVRRPALERFAATFPADGPLRLSPATTSRATVDRWFDQVGGALDGVVAKKLGVPYASGRRDAAVKIKKMRTADCVIGGFRYAKGSQTRVGSLLLGLFDPDGLLDYIGFCSAFSNAERDALLAKLSSDIGQPGFTGSAPDNAPSRWSRGEDRDRTYVKLRGSFVLEVEFDQVTSGRIRHGTRPLRWRTDKLPASCTVDQLEAPGAIGALLT
jgi:ATP-dependent DNA ligase